MRTDELDFPLPERLVAARPAEQRSQSRLLVVDCAGETWRHERFPELGAILAPGDLLVCNDTRVVPARLLARKSTGGAVEGLWLADRGDGMAECLLSGSRLRPGVELQLANGEYRLRLTDRVAPGRWLLEDIERIGWLRLLAVAGAIPLPPYVRTRRQVLGIPEEEAADAERYQTVWASVPGAVAAPTASLHFDADALAALEARGVRRVELTLHVGAGTFLPVASDDLDAHEMHAESYAVPATTVAALHATRRAGGRVIAVGTTVCRVLEHLARTGCAPEDPLPSADLAGVTQLFLRPGAPFAWTDALLTNFHTPRSTLLALVAAFAEAGGSHGLAFVKRVYAAAVAEEYRFYSYGDASLWLRGPAAKP
ncbi:MAG TPA: tRNA preQ1(34) S-adenosylmethionine ribosyltransferase-isomerase QueA [Planctomycetota bacterium]